jgi:adenine-specific DNA-methyltransferase
VVFGVTGEAGPQRKRFLSEAEERGKVAKTLWDDVETTTHATKALKDLMGEAVFDNPKPTDLLKRCIQLGTHDPEDAIVLDFFAGSGTTGHAVMALNAADGGNRRFILVQLPQPLHAENKEEKAAAAFCERLNKPANIAELTKERLRRAGGKMRDNNTPAAGDVGFRVFKLDHSNIRAWEPDRDNVEQTLRNSVDHLLPERSDADILYELLLKRGLDLCTPTEHKTIAGKNVLSAGSGALLVCLADQLTREDAEPLAQGIVAWHCDLAYTGETTVVFRDSAFADDVVKTNLSATLSQAGFANLQIL